MDTWVRNDFRCIFYNDGYKALKKYYENNKIDTLFINNDAVLQRNEETIFLGLNYLPVSEYTEHFKQFLNGLKHLEQNSYSFHYICIGENDDDKVELMFNAFTKPPLELEYPSC